MSEVQTLARGLKILNLLAESTDGLGSSELADLLAIDRGAMSRLMQTLEKYGYAERDPASRRYFVGAHLHEMSRHAGQHAALRELATPLLEQLNRDTTENAHLAILRGDHAVTIADVASQHTLRVVSEVGRRLPLYASAVGKCLLAFNESSIPGELNRYTEKTLVDTNALKNNLEKIRQTQKSIDDEELTIGVRGLAVPVRNREGRVIASLGISGPSVRLRMEDTHTHFQMLQLCATSMSRQLGYEPPEKPTV
ncbi:MAG: IclR family transcriptional regulator [Pseudomonadota bacterium]